MKACGERKAALNSLTSGGVTSRTNIGGFITHIILRATVYCTIPPLFLHYDGFGLLEAEATQDLAAAAPFVVENIGTNLKLVQWPEGLRDRLREVGEVVLYVRHEVSKLERLPEKAQTVFPHETAARKVAQEKAEKRPVTIKQEVLLALSFPSDELFEKFRKALLDAHCALEANKEKRQLTLSNSYQPQIQQVIEKLGEEYTIRLEETG